MGSAVIILASIAGIFRGPTDAMLDPRAEAMVVVTARAPVTEEESSSARAAIEAELGASDIRVLDLSVEREAIARCGAQEPFLCWSRAMGEGEKRPRVLLVVGLQGAGVRSLTGVAIALDIARRAPTGTSDADLDAWIFAQAVRPVRVELDAITGLVELLEPWLPAPRAMGVIRLVSPPEGISVYVDGVQVPSSGDIRAVPPGLRKIRALKLGREIFASEVAVAPGEVARVKIFEDVRQPEFADPLVRAPSHPLRRASFIVGGGLLLMSSFCFYGAAVEDGSRPGSPLLPLGVAGLLGGGAMVGGELWRDQESSWIPFVAGLALGGLAFGVGLAAQ